VPNREIDIEKYISRRFSLIIHREKTNVKFRYPQKEETGKKGAKDKRGKGKYPEQRETLEQTTQ
jgi:hypothetical protein